MPEQDDCCVWGLAEHQIPVATFSVISPKPPFPVSPQVSLVHSAPPLPVIYCLWLLPSLVYLVTRIQWSGLSSKGPGQRPSQGWGYCFPSGYCRSVGSGLPEHKGWGGLGDDSAPRSQRLLSQFSPEGFCPQSLLTHLQPTLHLLCLSPR